VVYDAPSVRALTHLLFVLLVLPGVVACGGGGTKPATATTATTAALPALATRPAAAGEIVVRGEGSPASKGPYTFDGRYLVRFVQYAPEDPQLDFTGQTPFAAQLAVRPDDPRGAVKLFEDAAASGRRELEIHGRRNVEVTFGDFPWVLRFTPRSGGRAAHHQPSSSRSWAGRSSSSTLAIARV
jgi:hypothetical protein